MSFRTIWTEPLGMLLASGSPGSALAYHLGAVQFRAGMMHGNTAPQGSGCDCADADRRLRDAFFHRARALR